MSDLLRELSEQISQGFMLKLAGIIGTAALVWAAKRLWDSVSTFFANKRFSLKGIWIGLCEMPQSTPVEVYRMVERNERVTFSFFSFRPNSTRAARFVGSGIFRGKYFSAFYYSPKAANQESGVLSLQLGGIEGDTLEGAFTQYTKADSLLPDRKKFLITHTKIPFFCQLRMIFCQQPFQTYDKAYEFYEKVKMEKATGLHHQPTPA